MSLLPGVSIAYKSNGDIYYRSSITYRKKHLSLGSFDSEEDASRTHIEAMNLLESTEYTVDDYDASKFILPFDKYIRLLNFRDNKAYVKTPIYMSPYFFTYYISEDIQLIFDVSDFIYFAEHKITKRGNHFFVSDFGLQKNLLDRYGVHNYSIVGRDYIFVNGDHYDFRRTNIKVINPYYGVTKISHHTKDRFEVKIHVKGDLKVGIYDDEIDAAIAYNKASDFLRKNGIKKKFPQNYIDSISPVEYLDRYKKINVRQNVINYTLS